MKTENSLLTIRKASDWLRSARTKSSPEMLFGEFWLEGELSIMFGDAGAGKSLLAVQIAQAIASGLPLDPVRQPSRPRQVLYFDLELTEKQFEMRYSREREADGPPGRQFQFSNRLSRVEVDLTADVPDEFDSLAEFLGAEIERMVNGSSAKVLIVDNINCLKRKYESIREALPLMAALDRMKRRYGLSILVLAHTPRRAGGRPIDISDMPGAKVLSNYADNVFAVGMSRMYPETRYLKQITPGNTARIFGEKTVPTFSLENLYGDFLGFRFLWFATEHDHLALRRERTDWEIIYRVRRLSDAGLTIREIAAKLNRSRSAIHRILHMLPQPELSSLSGEGQPDDACPADGVMSDYDISESSVDHSAVTTPSRKESVTLLFRQRREEVGDRDDDNDIVAASDTTVMTPDTSADDQGQYRLRERVDSSTALAATELASQTTEEPTNEKPAEPGLELEYNAYGKEVWVEARNEQGKPIIWYHHDRHGRRYRNERNSAGIYVTAINDAAAVDTS